MQGFKLEPEHTPSPTTTWQLLEEIKQHPIEAKGFNLKILKPQKIIFFVVAGIRSEAVLLKILARSRILGLHVVFCNSDNFFVRSRARGGKSLGSGLKAQA